MEECSHRRLALQMLLAMAGWYFRAPPDVNQPERTENEEPFCAFVAGRGRPGPRGVRLLLVLMALAAIGSIGGLATAVNNTFKNAATNLT